MKLSSTPLPGNYCFRGEGLEYTRKTIHDQVKTVHVVLSDTHKSMMNIQIKNNSMNSTAKAYNSCKPHSTETM
ncbi:hypothetical protein [Barnesiella intestinihominis]|uniref:hypothetical protein n=1 Tax=Barnesiella intestinihominis TaxID=487174 RepID=UPI002675AD8F|nr:hypothetical protein [Barnesiella intestinihominis]